MVDWNQQLPRSTRCPYSFLTSCAACVDVCMSSRWARGVSARLSAFLPHLKCVWISPMGLGEEVMNGVRPVDHASGLADETARSVDGVNGREFCLRDGLGYAHNPLWCIRLRCFLGKIKMNALVPRKSSALGGPGSPEDICSTDVVMWCCHELKYPKRRGSFTRLGTSHLELRHVGIPLVKGGESHVVGPKPLFPWLGDRVYFLKLKAQNDGVCFQKWTFYGKRWVTGVSLK